MYVTIWGQQVGQVGLTPQVESPIPHITYADPNALEEHVYKLSAFERTGQNSSSKGTSTTNEHRKTHRQQ